MSRMLAALTLFAAPPAFAEVPAEAALSTYAEKTRVTVQCSRPVGDTIVVCGRRAADKWRVPFLGLSPGDPRGESVSGERNRLASEPRPTCGVTAFFYTADCGMVGITVGTSFGGSSVRLRPLAD